MRYLTLLLIFFACTSGRAQCDEQPSLQAEARVAYLSNDLAAWDKVLATAQAAPDNADNQLQLARLALGASGSAMANQSDDHLKTYLDLMETSLDKFWKTDKKHPAAHGLYSAYLGMLIAQSPMKGMLYGSKSSKYAAKGVNFDAASQEAQYCLGSNLFYTPTTWGGDPDQAVEHLKAAAETLPTDRAACDWFHLQTLALLGQAQAKIGDTQAARMTYLQALKLEPEFAYVEKVLLPGLE
jgi:tetratricopeptide (TPR) repeat protein